MAPPSSATDMLDRIRQDGYFVPEAPVFDAGEVASLNREFDELLALLRPSEQGEIRGWHSSCRFLHDLALDERLLDLVEPVLGPSFYMWDTHFYVKAPRSNINVGWHQDIHVRAFDTDRLLTVSLVLEDRTAENGAMRLVPETHRREPDEQEVEGAGTLLALRAGQVALHDDRIVHGSYGNRTDGRRVGFNVRYASSDTRCDTTRLPWFRVISCRGRDGAGGNPPGLPPERRFARPDAK